MQRLLVCSVDWPVVLWGLVTKERVWCDHWQGAPLTTSLCQATLGLSTMENTQMRPRIESTVPSNH